MMSYVLFVPRYSDGVAVFHNDDVLSLQENLSRKKCDVHHINRHIAECLNNLLLPTDDLTPSRSLKTMAIFKLCQM